MEEGHFFYLAFRAQIELRNVKLKVGVPQMKHMYHNNNIHNQRVNQMFTGVPSQGDSLAKAPALYMTMSQEVVDEVHFLDLAVRA